ncbi:MAG: hypothetical protein ABH865_03020 [Candidatus Omnitrophota bacterium]
MKRLFLIFSMLCAACCVSYASDDLKESLRFGKVLVKELTVQPREKTELSIPAQEELWVGFYIDFPKKDTDAYRDKDVFIIKDKNSVVAVQGNDNGGTLFSPKDGVVEVIYENLSDESFPAIIWKKEEGK